MIDAVKLMIQEDYVKRSKKMEPQFQVASARLSASAGDELLHRSSNVLSTQGKRYALSSSLVAKTLEVRSSNNKSQSVGKKEVRKPRKASGLKGVKKSVEGPSSGNDIFDADSVQADVL